MEGDPETSTTARELWRGAVAKLAAARTHVDDGARDGDAFARVVKQKTFVTMVNGERAFRAAFGARSLRTGLSLSDDRSTPSREAVASAPPHPSSARSPSSVVPDAAAVDDGDDDAAGSSSNVEDHLDAAERVARFVRVEASAEEGLRVRSAYTPRFYLSPHQRFNYSQFFRSFLYEALLVPPAQWFAVMLVETALFRHSFDEALCCAGARFFAPIPLIGERARRAFRAPDGSANIGFFLGPIFVFPIVAVLADLGDTRRYLEPLELLPMLVMFLAQCGVIACKYGVLPASHTSDAHGKIYRPIKPADLTRTLILGAWNDPKNANHFDLLKMEIENACLEADVDLSHTEIHVGSAEAARAIRLRSRGIGERASGSDRREGGDGDPTSGGLAPEVVSGKELMAALVDVHVGRALPPSFMPGITLLSLLYGLAGPAARAYCGVPMFGATPASEFAAAGMFIFNVMMFLGNFMFAATCAWHYRRLFCVMRALSRMARFPGEPLENFFPPESEIEEEASSKEASRRSASSSSRSFRELRRAVADATRVGTFRSGRPLDALIDVKDPASCLGWSLVRRATRRVGSSWGRRMNLYSVIFLVSAFFSAGMLLGLYFGASTLTHRLATAACFYFLAIVISALVSLTVFEAAAINEQVPETRSWLKRESVAVAAQLAYLIAGAKGDEDEDEKSLRKREIEELRAARALIETVEQYVKLEEEESDPVEVFFGVKATPAAVTLVVSSLLSMLLIATQRGFTMMESEGWAYDGANGEFETDAGQG